MNELKDEKMQKKRIFNDDGNEMKKNKKKMSNQNRHTQKLNQDSLCIDDVVWSYASHRLATSKYRTDTHKDVK